MTPAAIEHRQPPADLLTRTIATIEDAEKWIKDLYAADLLWHMEDDPYDIHWSNGWEPTKQDEDNLARLQDEAWATVKGTGVDLIDFYPCGMHWEYHDGECPDRED